MPGLAVAGVAVRSGCVMLAIDLQALGHDSDVSNDTVLIETLSQAVAQMTAHVNVNSFTIQVRCMRTFACCGLSRRHVHTRMLQPAERATAQT